MIDLFGLEQQTPRKNDRPEAAALVEVLKALNTLPGVAWCERMNSGAARMGSRFVRFGFKGCRMGLVIRCQCDKHQGPPLA